MVNVGEYEKEQIYKLSSVNLCSNVVGQEAVELVVNRPKEGDESYPLFKKEKDQILNELKMKANIIRDALFSAKELLVILQWERFIYSLVLNFRINLLTNVIKKELILMWNIVF